MIIAPIEVVWYSPAGRDYPLDNICLVLDSVEEDFVISCLGYEMWLWMTNNAEPWPDDTGEWCDGTDYSMGEYVTREGRLFMSLENDNTNDPLDDGDTPTWEEPKRFGSNECMNELWENYLRKLIANNVYKSTLNFTTQKTGANGLTVLESGSQFNGQSFRSGSKAELVDYKISIDTINATLTKSMMRWIKGTNLNCGDAPLFSIPGCGRNNESCSPSLQKRRWGFKY